jgi:hypothetical protein
MQTECASTGASAVFPMNLAFSGEKLTEIYIDLLFVRLSRCYPPLFKCKTIHVVAAVKDNLIPYFCKSDFFKLPFFIVIFPESTLDGK